MSNKTNGRATWRLKGLGLLKKKNFLLCMSVSNGDGVPNVFVNNTISEPIIIEFKGE